MEYKKSRNKPKYKSLKPVPKKRKGAEKMEIRFELYGVNFTATPCGYSYFRGCCRWSIYDEYDRLVPYYDPRIKNYPVVTSVNKHFFNEILPASPYYSLTPKMKCSKLVQKFMKEEAKKFTVITLKSKDDSVKKLETKI